MPGVWPRFLLMVGRGRAALGGVGSGPPSCGYQTLITLQVPVAWARGAAEPVSRGSQSRVAECRPRKSRAALAEASRALPAKLSGTLVEQSTRYHCADQRKCLSVRLATF